LDYQQFAEDHHLRIDIEDRVAIVRLNRPEKRNAINFALHEGLEKIWRPLGTDPDVGAIVITGEGKGFCAGGDMLGFYPSDPGPFEKLRGPKNLVQEMVNCEAPIVSAVHGVAAGLGATLALLADIIYMADDARIGDTHVKMGLVAGDGGAAIWPLLIGLHRAKELLMGGDLVTGLAAAEMGLINYSVPASDLLPRAIAHARKLAEGPAVAIRLTKMTLNQHLRNSINLTLDAGLAAEMLSVETADAREAGQAFAEKRDPRFLGR
jgi:enoyl-CoA hydratase